MWTIIGTSQYGTEEIDEFDTLAEAHEMVREYRIAFGSGWTLTISRNQ